MPACNHHHAFWHRSNHNDLVLCMLWPCSLLLRLRKPQASQSCNISHAASLAILSVAANEHRSITELMSASFIEPRWVVIFISFTWRPLLSLHSGCPAGLADNIGEYNIVQLIDSAPDETLWNDCDWRYMIVSSVNSISLSVRGPTACTSCQLLFSSVLFLSGNVSEYIERPGRS